ncbi:hypothetical protein KBC79_03595 [Candidatus Woesebacteria bacterium]|nr:hypothetical protein [Candidatus Woesebacteria bacterium]
MKSIEQRVESIEHRNTKVDLDKRWETSWTRRILIISFTYILLGSYMWAIGVTEPLLNAVIPTIGFTLSTLSMPFFRRKWEKFQRS